MQAAAPLLRYVRFHPRADVCEHCGAGLLRGAVELSDGKKYGRDCAARAMGRKREDSAMKRQVEALRLAAIRAEHRAAFANLTRERSTWRWVGKAYAQLVGEATEWQRPDGTCVLEVIGQIVGVLYERVPDAVLGSANGTAYVAMSRADLVALDPYLNERAFPWTAKRWATWQSGKGWAE